jgi:AcrR family transcriptional regulator
MEDRGSGLLAPLPRGRHGLTREEVAAHQRERIANGIATTVARYGYSGLTVEKVIATAGVSRSTFYSHFRDKRDAVSAARELIMERFLTAVTESCARRDGPAGIGQATSVAIRFAMGSPEQFQILFPELGDPDHAEVFSGSFDRLAELLGEVRPTSPYGSGLPACTEWFLIAGGASIIRRWLAKGCVDNRHDLQQQLVELFLIPYYGRARAARLAKAS